MVRAAREGFLTPQQAAERLGCSAESVRGWCRPGGRWHSSVTADGSSNRVAYSIPPALVVSEQTLRATRARQRTRVTRPRQGPSASVDDSDAALRRRALVRALGEASELRANAEGLMLDVIRMKDESYDVLRRVLLEELSAEDGWAVPQDLTGLEGTSASG